MYRFAFLLLSSLCLSAPVAFAGPAPDQVPPAVLQEPFGRMAVQAGDGSADRLLAWLGTSPVASASLSLMPPFPSALAEGPATPAASTPPEPRQPASPAPVVPRGSGGLSTKQGLLILLSVLLTALAITLLLLFRKGPRRRRPASASTTLIQHDWAELHHTAEPATSAPESATPAAEGDQPPVAAVEAEEQQSFQEKLREFAEGRLPDAAGEKAEEIPVAPQVDLTLVGKLSPAQVPAMLQFIASTNRPGTLVVRSEFSEKRLTFKNGKIIAASTVNLANRNQAGFLMNKLGYLLVRQGKISEEDRDQALALCDGDPTLKLGEALIKLGKLKRNQLRGSLQDQAVMVLHSMIVFPEGDYQFIPEKVSIPARESLEIQVSEFLRDAASHQTEWRNIRQMIPSLDVVLDFAPGGKDKFSSGRMTVHQKFILSLIDGKRPIREICNEATMLDYELYRFLYLMVKANILRLVDET